MHRKILITGSNGFIGKNLVVRLGELAQTHISTFTRGDDPSRLHEILENVDSVVHLAGENRPNNDAAYSKVNAELTRILCNAIKIVYVQTGRHIPILLASSTQVEKDNPYGRSKLAAEQELIALSKSTDNPCIVFRFPGVFGKWCKPNYNSVVATFCYNLARDLPIHQTDPDTILKLVYIDDVVSCILNALNQPELGYKHSVIQPEYQLTLGELAAHIRSFSECRSTLKIERVGSGLLRALYATYISYLPEERFSYELPKHSDSRGIFVEMLKTSDSGQFSYFTTKPGVTRGGHYHHSKTEKFLVLKGEALFRFRHLLTGELVEIRTSGSTPQVVDTLPGWSHDISNLGSEELVVMLWANENFDPNMPDTISSKVLS